MVKNFINWLLAPTKKGFWIQPFPEHLPEECFDCNRSNCDGCEYK